MNRHERELAIESVSASVRCEGKLHEIRMEASGTLRLVDHDRASLEAVRAAQALGGSCRCLSVLLAWKQGRRAEMPSILGEARKACAARGQARRDERSACDEQVFCGRSGTADFRLWTLKQERNKEVEDAALTALHQVNYRVSRARTIRHTTPEVQVLSARSTGIVERDGVVYMSVGRVLTEVCEPASIRYRSTTHESHVVAYLPRSWLQTVSDRGLAVIDGCFVLDVIAPDGKLVRAAKQHPRGFEIRTGVARVVERHGQRALAWLTPFDWKRPAPADSDASNVSV